MQRYERLWERLLTLLGTLGEVDASTSGRIRLHIDRQRVELVMTERDWEDLVSIPYGSFAGGARHLLHALSAAEAAEVPYLVYYNYELEPSATPESPTRMAEEAEHRRVMDHLRTHPDARAEWRAYPPGHGDEPTLAGRRPSTTSTAPRGRCRT
ncbi:hypothetical protein GCM10011376_32850 [Nocardioides flavus (ex Wang et al. 2016)]|uniref:Uncharacterized protein n=1 Tax=Nocardioides flavus (ex Wang et al. 2016) TaxID=2058780 RepID=A0ABQ3HS31_9ACTN|nr:hypothetical protein [Nocardioides flavus (ex Wang et al. 2016)]GHE18675.1 hypothetical protein GCM10011376_32850 [Nocardioides flavus (ex Wang et al. 2016)]